MKLPRRPRRSPDLYAGAMDRRRVARLFLATPVIVLGACTGGSSSAELTVSESVVQTTEAPVETAADVTVVDTTPPTSPATPPPTDAPQSTETPETTAAPPPATADELTIEEQINRDLALGEEALAVAGANPGSADAREEVARFFGGENLMAVNSIFDQLRDEGWIALKNPNTPSFTVVTGGVNLDGETAITTICRVDSGIVVDPGATESANDDFVINAEINRYVQQVRLQLQDSNWKRVENIEDVSVTRGVTTCDG